METKRELTDTELEDYFSFVNRALDDEAIKLIDIMADVDKDVKYFDDYDFYDFYCTPLIYACKHGRLKVVEHLIALGVNVNKVSEVDECALYRAAESGDLEIVKALVNAGAKVDFVGEDNYNSLMYAIRGKNLEVIKFVIDSGLDIETHIRNEFSEACSRGDYDVVKFLIENGINVNRSESFEGYTALHFACIRNHLNVVDLLLQNGADETMTLKNGKTLMELIDSEETKVFLRNYSGSKYVLK